MTTDVSMRERREALPLQNRAAPVTTVDAEARTVEVVWTTGAAVRRRRYDWDTSRVIDYDEILVVSRSAIDLSRLERGAPVLDSHSAYETASQLAVVERAWIEDGKGMAVLRFPAKGIDENIDRFFALVADGQRRNISVGYSVDKVRVEPGVKKEDTEQWFVERWTPHELSFVTIPADMDAQVRRTAGPLSERSAEHQYPVVFTVRAEPGAAEEAAMADPTKTAAEPAAPIANDVVETRAAAPVATAPVAPPVDMDAVRAAAALAERTRTVEIRTVGRKYNMGDEFIDEAIEKSMSVQDFRNAVLDKLADAGTRTGPRVGDTGVIMGGQDETVTRREAAIAALLNRADPIANPLTDAARAYRGMPLIRLAEEALSWKGERSAGLSTNEIAYRALHSSSDFPAILAAVTNKMFLGAYQAAPQTFRPLVRTMTLSDFNEAHLIRMGAGPKMKKMGEHGEYKRGTLAESKETVSLSTYGTVVGITRKVIINDDLGAFTRMPQMFGQSVATLESDIVWGLWLSNPALKQDETAVFHTVKHKNLASSGTILGEAPISVAQTAMSKQVDLDGKTTLNIVPSYLVVPPELRAGAEKLLAQFTPAKTSDVVPDSIQRLQTIVEPRLSNGVVDADNGINASGSGTAWYLAVNPNASMVDTIVVAYLDGQSGPYTESRQGFEIDGMEIKCRHDFGAAWADFRGVYKDPGAAPG